MTTAAALLILTSVVLHVGWNTISKRVEATPAFFLLASVVSSLALSPVLVWQRGVAGEALQLVLPVLIPTGLFAAGYNVSLARAYRGGDLTLIYPLARSLGPVGVALASVALGRGGEIGAGCLLGIAIVVVGSAFLPLERFGAFRLARYRSPSFLAALATATATVGYTLCDDQALRFLRGADGLGLGTAERSLLYASLQAWATTLCLGAWVLARPGECAAVPRALRATGRQALVVGVFGYGSYILVLASMAFVDDVTYVAAFRQVSVPVALVVGALVLQERVTWPRITGGALCTVGLLLVALL